MLEHSWIDKKNISEKMKKKYQKKYQQKKSAEARKNAISGFYRIWITINNEEISYVGISTNIQTRIKTHFQKIRSFYGLTEKTKTFIPWLERGAIPARDAFYWKATFLLHLHNKQPSDFQWEILKRTAIDIVKSQFEGIELIEKYQTDTKGLNGIFAKDFQLGNTMLWSDDFDPDLQKLQNIQDKRKKRVLQQLNKCQTTTDYEKHFQSWIIWQFRLIEREIKITDSLYKKVWLDKVAKVLSIVK